MSAIEQPSRDTAQRASILIREEDHRRLYALAMGQMLLAPRVAGRLLDELERADVRPDAEVPDDVAGIGSWVTYRDEAIEAPDPTRVQLVTPMDADPGRGQLSVLSSIGSALIGLRPGQALAWNDRRGRSTRLTVLAVSVTATNIA